MTVKTPLLTTICAGALLALAGCATTMSEVFSTDFFSARDPTDPRWADFDIYNCEAARQLVATFQQDGNSVAVMFDGAHKVLYRPFPPHPFSDGIYRLYIMEDGTLLLEKEDATLRKRCTPVVGEGPHIAVLAVPTITPDQYHSGETMFERKMGK